MKIIIIAFMISSQLINRWVNGDAFLSTRSIFDNFNLLNSIFGPHEPEVHMDTVQILRHMGYRVEVHNVTTSDGYILGLHRIPSRSNNQNKNPVLLLHGVGRSSSDWVINLRSQSLAYVLSDAGYDVWLGNFRGNEYSRRHVSLNPNHNQFWVFSQDELAAYDLPAMIDYVLQTTGKSQITVIAHSMGTTIAFATLASKPEYNDKVQKMFALGPLVFLNHITDPFIVSQFSGVRIFDWFTKIFNIDHIPAEIYRKFLVIVCNSPLRQLCMRVLLYPSAEGWQYSNSTRTGIYFSQTPSDYSVKSFDHYVQIIDKKQWQHYDWGAKKNLAKYGTKTPPKYDISNVSVPVALFRGDRDVLSTCKDVHQLEKSLINLIGSYEIKGWSHYFYIYATNAGEALHNKILELAEK